MNRLDTKQINMYDLLICLTNAGDLVNPKLTGHHQQVAYLSYRIARQLGLSVKEQYHLLLAGLLHDVGALSYHERLSLIEEETPTAQDHAFKGARLIENFEPLTDVADLIRYHHLPWDDGAGEFFAGNPVSPFCHIVHLADRIAVRIDRDREIIGQIKDIREGIVQQRGTVFVPEHVDAFLTLSTQEYIWLDVVYKPLLYILPHLVTFDVVELDLGGIIELTRIISHIIDFRSPFTARHSAGVAKSAQKLACLAGFSENEQKMMLIAGYLHDFGKLAVPNEVLEKPSKLNVDEFNIIRSHTFYTYRLLQPIDEFATINTWASLHHEKLDGTGYPFHLRDEEIPLGSRIMAVADVFTAITEDRPYRKGMSNDRIISVFDKMVANRSLCPYVVSLLMNNLDILQSIREKAQQDADTDYTHFQQQHDQLA